MTIYQIQQHLNYFDFDIRKSNEARWIDQKCTPDVVCFIAECVLNYYENNPTISDFTVNDIWDSQYFNENVTAVFGKPDAQNETASSEYDKFIQQPLRMLGYAEVLTCEKKGSKNIYAIAEYDLLNFIASKERNTYKFMFEYVCKVLKDSDLFIYFEGFKNLYASGKATKSDFQYLKDKFIDFTISNTPINTPVEVRRIFPKIINLYACENKIAGTEKGYMSDHIITFSELMYNRLNWRDVGKSKEITRQEFEITNAPNHVSDYNSYLISKAMNQVRRRYKVSEINDEWANSEATEVHHIFMKHEFPQLAAILENLVKLTPTQHRNKAHPNGNYRVINKDYQYICLIAKSNSIEFSLNNGEDFYSLESFVFVINTGLTENLSEKSSINQIRQFLARAYNRE